MANILRSASLNRTVSTGLAEVLRNMARGRPSKIPMVVEGQICHEAELTWEGSFIGQGKGVGERREKREGEREKTERQTKIYLFREMVERESGNGGMGRACLLNGPLHLHTEQWYFLPCIQGWALCQVPQEVGPGVSGLQHTGGHRGRLPFTSPR